MVGRLVGFYEYGNALMELDRLVMMLSESELAEIDKLVGEKDEFMVYTNLSRRVQSGPSTLDVGDDNVDRPVDEKYEGRRGLAWVMALARVELAAMLAGFTEVPRPFEAVRPTHFDAQAYKEMMLDGARTHYWALANDPMLEPVTRMRADQTAVLSYSRRLVIARAMLRAAMKAGMNEYSPIQVRELASWSQRLDELQVGFITKIEQFLEDQHRTWTTKKRSKDTYEVSCYALLQAERRERAEGTAQITRIP
jgi:hypothetical protein